MQRRLLGIAIGAAIAFAAAPSYPQAQPLDDGKVLTAFAIDMQQGARTGMIEIAIDRWSTPQERRGLLAALDKEGQRGLERALRASEEVGRIRSASGLGYPLRYASRTPTEDGGRRIVVVTDRPVGFGELWAQARALDYPFLVAEVRLDPDDTGDGRLSTAAQIRQVNGHILIENFELQPIRLERVQVRD